MARGRVVRRSGPRRKSIWIAPALATYVGVAGGGATLISSFDPDAAGLPSPTIVRTRGFVSVQPTSVAADLEITGAMGIGIVSDQAFIAGVASIPEPFTDADWDGWYVHQMFNYKFQFSDATGFNFPRWDFEIDSKAMRKIGPNETIVVVAESFTGGMDIAISHRTLLKLS